MDSGAQSLETDAGDAGIDADALPPKADARMEAASPPPTVDGGICTTDGRPFPQEGGLCAGEPCTAGCECANNGENTCDCTRAIPPEAGTFCVPTNCGTLLCGSSFACASHMDSASPPPKTDASMESSSRPPMMDAGTESAAPFPTIDGGICTTNGQPFPQDGVTAQRARARPAVSALSRATRRSAIVLERLLPRQVRSAYRRIAGTFSVLKTVTAPSAAALGAAIARID
jgi:hypothetical protein